MGKTDIKTDNRLSNSSKAVGLKVKILWIKNTTEMLMKYP